MRPKSTGHEGEARGISRRRATAALVVIAVCASAASAGTLREAAARRGFFVGAAVDVTALQGEARYRRTLAREFNTCVAENAFKFERIHPQRDTYDFVEPDALASFAAANGMRLRGHTLVWHNQLPDWVAHGTFTRDEAVALMRDHIAAVAGRYRGKVWAWDVVNEAVADDGSGLRTNSFWYRTIGPDFVDMAFQFAREADPDALLFYNDYGAEGAGPKADAVYALVRGLKERGVPIDGVGWQMHVENGYRTNEGHRANAGRLAALGLKLMVTELDVRIHLPASAVDLAQQADTYRDIVTFCLSEPAFLAVLTWGFTDKHSWIPGFFPGTGAALLFDRQYRRKPAYFAVRSALMSSSRR